MRLRTAGSRTGCLKGSAGQAASSADETEFERVAVVIKGGEIVTDRR
jgi:hypothetical protein